MDYSNSIALRGERGGREELGWVLRLALLVWRANKFQLPGTQSTDRAGLPCIILRTLLCEPGTRYECFGFLMFCVKFNGVGCMEVGV